MSQMDNCQLKRRRAKFREEATRLVDLAKKNWSAEEIEKATGYKVFVKSIRTSKTREVTAKQLAVGMVIVSKKDESRHQIVSMMPGMGVGPYLTLLNIETGVESEGDTCWDSRSAKYTVECPDEVAAT